MSKSKDKWKIYGIISTYRWLYKQISTYKTLVPQYAIIDVGCRPILRKDLLLKGKT
jgi:hypothetical protein